MGSFGREGDRLIGGRYRLGSRLGRGGMGTVWRATDQLLGRQVAVKELHLDDGFSEADARTKRERTLREARTVAQCRHPSIIVVHDVVEQDERPWIIMELVDGRSLADQLAADGPLPPREAARIALALLGAIRVAHEHGVLHRDIKPANVLVEAGTGRAVLTDFGVAHVSGSTTITETGSFVGSPEYTAPERMAGIRTGPESDLWSLGVLLCTMLSGTSPFHRDSLGGVLHAVVSDEICPPEAADPLLPLVRGLLERDPERRMGAAEAERLLTEYLRTGRMPGAPSASTPTQRVLHPIASISSSASLRAPQASTASATSAGGQSLPPSIRARTVMVAALLAVSVGAAGVAAVAMVVNGNGPGGLGGPMAKDGGSVRPTSRAHSPSPSRPVSPAVTVTSTMTASGSPSSSRALAPPGYRMVSDPAGFRLAVPTGFRRSFEPPRVFYYSPGKVFRLGIHIQDPVPGGPLGAMRKADAEAPDRYAGYRGGMVTPTSHDGAPAALWEFTWNGFTADGGPHHTIDLSWEEAGKLYDLCVSAPVGERAAARRLFDTTLKTFTRIRPSS